MPKDKDGQSVVLYVSGIIMERQLGADFPFIHTIQIFLI